MLPQPALAADRPNLRVLVLEDNPVQRTNLHLTLRRLGLSDITDASDGQSAMDLVEQSGQPFDVAICDLQMAGMDGIEFIRRSRGAGLHAIVVTSALDEPLLHSVETMARAYGTQVLGRLQKPVRAAALKALLDRYRPEGHANGGSAATGSEWPAAVLSAAIAAGEFIPHFQPKVNLRTGQIVGAEVLARWNHPQHGMLAPAQFLCAVEAGGLMRAMTDSLVERAFLAWVGWRRHGKPVPLAINVSPTLLQDTSMPQRLREAARRHAVDTELITIEMTEDALAGDTAGMLETLTRLRLAGFRLALDDFGTGYASLQQLSRIPFTELKIDRCFIAQAVETDKSRALLEGALMLTHRLKLQSVAEGVETSEQMALLNAFGCQLGQGFLLGRPMSASMLFKATTFL